MKYQALFDFFEKIRQPPKFENAICYKFWVALSVFAW